jgi:hypothetical protein
MNSLVDRIEITLLGKMISPATNIAWFWFEDIVQTNTIPLGKLIIPIYLIPPSLSI